MDQDNCLVPLHSLMAGIISFNKRLQYPLGSAVVLLSFSLGVFSN